MRMLITCFLLNFALFLEWFQLRDEIVENFENSERNYFCESDWNKLIEWKWNENITDDQQLTSRVCNQ